jgi:hypothetical protein
MEEFILDFAKYDSCLSPLIVHVLGNKFVTATTIWTDFFVYGTVNQTQGLIHAKQALCHWATPLALNIIFKEK